MKYLIGISMNFKKRPGEKSTCEIYIKSVLLSAEVLLKDLKYRQIMKVLFEIFEIIPK